MEEQGTLEENKRLHLENFKLCTRLDKLQGKYNKLWTIVFAVAVHIRDVDEAFEELMEWYKEELR